MKLLTKYALFVTVWVATVLFTGCNATNTYETTLNSARLSGAIVDFETSLSTTGAVIDSHQDQFTPRQWEAITLVRVNTREIHKQLSRLRDTSSTNGAVVDISELITQVQSLRHNYKRAYVELRLSVHTFPPSLQGELVAFNQSIRRLDAAYTRLVKRESDNTQLIIETLRIIGAGVKLFGM